MTWANITFVDAHDRIIGHGSRQEAISKGLIHRIARVFVVNSKGELLIQKRSPKVALPNKWDQSAAGHVDEGEDYLTAAAREASEEVGLTGVDFKEIGKFYTEESDGREIKKRYNMLYEATSDKEPIMDDGEVSEIKWITPEELEAWMNDKPDDFTEGFQLSYKYYSEHRKLGYLIEKKF